MATINFELDGIMCQIQCNIQETMKIICQRFANKKGKDVTKLLFIYNGSTINEDLTFQQQANEEDKVTKIMHVLVQENKVNQNNTTIIKSTDIICPECNENILINFIDYKINLINCKNGHNINNISFEEFQNTQNIDISKIICDICKERNKSTTHKNEFWKCNSCSKNLCPLCKDSHKKKEKEHKIINYSLKDYICKKDNINYTKYCNQCQKNLCMQCSQEHRSHQCIYFDNLLPNNENINSINELKKSIDKFNDNIEDIITKLKNVKKNMDIFYKIINDIIKNYKVEYVNYQVLININEVIRYKDIIIKDINEIINTDNINIKFNGIMNIYNKINYKNNNINEIKTNLMANCSSNSNPELPKINIIFTDKKGMKRNLVLNYGTTIDQALKQYLNAINKSQLINSGKINFIYNITKLEFGNNTPIEQFFRNSMNPRIIVNEH